ncbi:MAG: alcohol dehydrogenase catalytic domain-containing protein [Actinomycetota bacterium]|nr:alcohol dehydrogenase catalytic domain-containing protein [Actinomycetota bacterium]
MKAVVFAGSGRVRVEDVAAPRIQEAADAIVRVTKSSICASDLHLLDGKTPGMREGSVIGHEYVGTVVETGPEAGFEEGAEILGSFLIACGRCVACARREFNFCRNRRALGLGVLTGDLDGAQAELVRVPDASVNLHALKGAGASGGSAGEGLSEERALFGGDVLTTGFYAAGLGEVGEGDRVAVIGAGPVGLSCVMAARLRSPRQLLLLDRDPARLDFARRHLDVQTIDASEMDPQAAVAGATEGEMADVVIEAVGTTPVFKAALKCVRDGGRVAVIGVYGTERYELPMGMVWIRGLDIRFSGMANVQAHWETALDAIDSGAVDPTILITHRLPLESAEEGYELFASREAMKVVLTP